MTFVFCYRYVATPTKQMKNNQELQTDVQNAIKWEPLLNAAETGVIAKDVQNHESVQLTAMTGKWKLKMQPKKLLVEKGWRKNYTRISVDLCIVCNK